MNSFIKKILFIYAITLGALFIGSAVDNDPALNGVEQFIAQQKIDKQDPRWKHNLVKPPQFEFVEGKSYFWELVTSKGKIVIELFPQYAPMHVSSTMYLNTTIEYYVP